MKSARHLPKIVVHILLFGLLLFYSRSYKATYIDDAFIQFQYAKMLATTGTWGFFDGIITNTATSPLNVLLLSFLSLFTRSVVEAAVWLSAIEFYLLLIFLCLISKYLFAGKYFGAFAFVAFITNPLLLSTLGMESWLFILLLVIALYLLLREKWFALAIALGLLTLARPDGVLLFILVLFMVPASTRARLTIVYFLTMMPWYVFSWIYLGSVFPDTLIIKTFQKNWQGRSFSAGLGFFYLSRFPVATWVSFLLLPFGLFSLPSKNRDVRRMILLIGGFVLLHFAAYTRLRVPPYHWYYVPLTTGSVLLGSLGIASMIQRFSQNKRAWPVFGLSLLIPILGFLAVAKNNGFPFTEAPIHTNWATHGQYETAGLWLRSNTDPDSKYQMMGEIGTLAYYSDRRLINNFSSENNTLYLIEQTRRKRNTILNKLFNWNFHWRHMKDEGAGPSFRLVHSFMRKDRIPIKGDLMRWNTSSSWCPEGTLILQRNDIPMRDSKTRDSLNQ